MITRSRLQLLLPTLATGLALALVLAVPVRAQDHGGERPVTGSATLRVNLGTALHWAGIGGTRVEELPATERPEYDMFRYGGTYYVYDNNRWYNSPREYGDYVAIDERSVPSEFSNVPREHWHNYPSAWQGRPNQAPRATSATLQVNLGSTPHWAGIRGTEVEELPTAERPNYDMFRFRGAYYVHSDGRWFMSRTGSGEFIAIDDRDVPDEFSGVPREHWQNYPSDWRNHAGRGRYAAPSTMQVDLGYRLRWVGMRGTRVQWVRGRERPDYDLFRYAGSFYAYNDHQWYMSRQGRGRFDAIDEREVPAEVGRVPREFWRNYPERWSGRGNGYRSDNRGH